MISDNQLCRRLCDPDGISDPTLFSQNFWENHISFWASYWYLDRFAGKQLKMLEKQLYGGLWAPGGISDPTLFSRIFWENYFSFWASYWNLDRFGWKQLKMLEKQLCWQNRSSFQYGDQNENRAPRKIRSLNMCLEIISDWHRPSKLPRNVLPTPLPSLYVQSSGNAGTIGSIRGSLRPFIKSMIIFGQFWTNF